MKAAPALSPTRPLTGYCRWVAGWGSGPVQVIRRLHKENRRQLDGCRRFPVDMVWCRPSAGGGADRRGTRQATDFAAWRKAFIRCRWVRRVVDSSTLASLSVISGSAAAGDFLMGMAPSITVASVSFVRLSGMALFSFVAADYLRPNAFDSFNAYGEKPMKF